MGGGQILAESVVSKPMSPPGFTSPLLWFVSLLCVSFLRPLQLLSCLFWLLLASANDFCFLASWGRWGSRVQGTVFPTSRSVQASGARSPFFSPTKGCASPVESLLRVSLLGQNHPKIAPRCPPLTPAPSQAHYVDIRQAASTSFRTY